MRLPNQMVIDASVLIKYVVPENETPVVQQIIHEALANDQSVLHIPDLIYIECANILWKKVQRGHIDVNTADAGLHYLSEIELTTTPITKLMTSALSLACAYKISAYDACYVALAAQHRLPLLTADRKLIKQLAGTSHQLITIDELCGY